MHAALTTMIPKSHKKDHRQCIWWTQIQNSATKHKKFYFKNHINIFVHWDQVCSPQCKDESTCVKKSIQMVGYIIRMKENW